MPSPLDREEYTRQLLTLLAEGHEVTAIARRLNKSDRTIRRHLGLLLDRTGCRSYTHLAVWATARGLAHPAVPPASGPTMHPDPSALEGGCTCQTPIAS